MLSGFANLLTLSRIMVIPVLVVLLVLPQPWAAWTGCLLFAAAAATDFFDGYVARWRNEVSRFGKFLDPVADKLLVAATLLLVVGLKPLSVAAVLAAVVILCRELVVSGLREFLAGMSVDVPVSKLAKWKTAVQLVAIAVLIVGDVVPGAVPMMVVGEVALVLAAILSVYTGWNYLRAGVRHMLSSA